MLIDVSLLVLLFAVVAVVVVVVCVVLGVFDALLPLFVPVAVV